MRRFIRPIRRYASDPVYRNFVRKEYRRRMLAHSEPETGEGEEGEDAPRRVYHAVQHHKVIAVFLAVVAVLSTFLYANAILKTVFFIVLLFLASISTIYKRRLGMPLGGFELVTFGTVLVALAYNPVVGLLFGVVASLFSEILSQTIGPLTWIYVATMGAVGFFAGYLEGVNLVVLGVGASILALLVNQVVYLFIGDEEIKSMTALYIVTNLLVNFLLFSTLGSRILSVI